MTELPSPSLRPGGPPSRAARRLLLVHAHPDDESINNGATMAKYAAEGARVTLVTCTLGERGEVIPPELGHLTGAALGEYRLRELADAMRELGVDDFRLLGGAGRYRDSGMMGLPDNDDPACFWQADLDEAAGYLVEVILEVRPQVLVTYDDNGGYGHPDHIQAHRVAMRAAELAADAGWRIPKVYWNRVPRSVAEDAFARLQGELSGLPFAKSAALDDVPGVVDEQRRTPPRHSTPPPPPHSPAPLTATRPSPADRGSLTVGAAKAGALLDRQLTLARTRAHSTALQALGSSRFHAVADKVALLASEVPLKDTAASTTDLRPLAAAARDRLTDAVAALPLVTAGSPYNAQALIHGLSPDPAPHPQDAQWHQVRLLLRLHRYALEVLSGEHADGTDGGTDVRLLAAGEALDRHRDASEAAAAA
ncbi:N-acetyl-1-D-myo-inositol-2-amino-2-deoxy-alpha-D-glucopyranoside deacetylase, partial [Streptomyces sp. NPDC058964]|uniref:N-acetyl-1-D-myo-inositol-2-amino-2-deoxy-alpha- D-glucopyranoside deacetylase n=1 Tax=Streptomyces sp. NPDC058964 TaxID=3346681 RepID=UPI003685130D